MQRSATEWIIFLIDSGMIWDREPGNWSTTTPGTGVPSNLGNVANGRKAPAPQTVTITVPGEVISAEVARPAAGGRQDDGTHLDITSANEALGRTFGAPRPLTTVGANKTFTVPNVAGYTKAIRVRTA